MMFLGRERELEVLNRFYRQSGFQMPVLYGRRRIGKTRLLREFCKDKKFIFYTGTQDEAEICLRDFTGSIRETDLENHLLQSMESFPSWNAAFDYITEMAAKERLILVIDEFPYLAKAYPAISSILQKYIDTKWKETELYLILSGSSMSFMEKQVLGYESPLYGRRTSQIKLMKMDYYDSIKFFEGWTAEDKLYAYGACDGIPQYLEIFSRWGSFREAVENEYLLSSGGMFDEPELLIKEELREPAVYNSIIEAVANGANRNSEIADKIGKAANVIAPYLKNLIALEILEKRMPIEETSAKKTIFAISDKMFYFWYRFIPKCRYQIAMGLKEHAYEKKIEPHLSEYFGLVFEEICKQYVLRLTADGRIGEVYDDYGKWWGANPQKKCQEEIDFVAVNSTKILTGECKWTREPVGYPVLQTLMERSGLIRKNRDISYYLFSKSGFEERLWEQKEENVFLVSLENLLEV